jgi:transposase
MYTIGVDVSKKELVAAKLTKRGEVIERWMIANEPAAIARWLDSLPHSLLGAEATAEYHNTLARLCIAHGIPFKLLNPIVTKQFTRATVRRRKTDRSDAEVIAHCLLRGEGYLLSKESFSPARRILRTAEKIRRINCTLVRMEAQMRTFVKEADTAPIARLAQNAKDAASAIHTQGVRMADETQTKLLSSIPGIGTTLSATIASEIGDCRRFRSGKALVAYAGLDPRVKQSGATLSRNTHLTKRGSPYLRRAFFLAAMIAERCDPELKAYYEKKRSEGKRFTEATVANARHVAHRVYAVLKRGTPYVERDLSTAET